MRIEGPGGIKYTTNVSRPKKTSGASASNFADMVSSETSASEGVTSASPVMAIDQLIGLQEVDDALNGKKQAKQHGFDILDKLDMLRLQILDGKISKEQLMQLARSVTARRAVTADPHLLAILDEIDLRAQVEIAKFTRDIAP